MNSDDVGDRITTGSDPRISRTLRVALRHANAIDQGGTDRREEHDQNDPRDRFASRSRSSRRRRAKGLRRRRHLRALREHVANEEAGDRRTEERADPVDVPVVEEPGGDRGREPARGVHGGARERSAEQDVGHDREADAEARDARCEGRDRGAVDGPHQEDRQERLDDDADGGRDRSREGRGAEVRLVDRGDGEVEHVAQRESGEQTADELREPIGGDARPRMPAGDGEAEGHGWIEVPTRQRAERGDRDRERDAVRERDLQQAARVHRGDREDRARPDEEEPERAAGLRDERANVLRQESLRPRSGILAPMADFRPVEAMKARILNIHPAPTGTTPDDANAEWIEVVVQLDSDLANWRVQHLRARWREGGARTAGGGRGYTSGAPALVAGGGIYSTHSA